MPYSKRIPSCDSTPVTATNKRSGRGRVVCGVNDFFLTFFFRGLARKNPLYPKRTEGKKRILLDPDSRTITEIVQPRERLVEELNRRVFVCYLVEVIGLVVEP